MLCIHSANRIYNSFRWQDWPSSNCHPMRSVRPFRYIVVKVLNLEHYKFMLLPPSTVVLVSHSISMNRFYFFLFHWGPTYIIANLSMFWNLFYSYSLGIIALSMCPSISMGFALLFLLGSAALRIREFILLRWAFISFIQVPRKFHRILKSKFAIKRFYSILWGFYSYYLLEEYSFSLPLLVKSGLFGI